MRRDPIVGAIRRIRQPFDPSEGAMDGLAKDVNRRPRDVHPDEMNIVRDRPRQPRTERAWMEEIQRRSDAIDLGEARLIDHEEVVAYFARRFGSSPEGRP